MAAASYDIILEKGADYLLSFLFKDSTGAAIDLTEATFKSHVRETADSNVILTSFDCTKDPDETGRLVLSLTGAQTADLDFTEAVYDLFMVNGGISTRMVAGSVTLTPTVTR